MFRLHDTAAGELRPLQPREPGKVSIYVCGPTVYGPPHLGHGRHALVYDVLRRYLGWSGLDVTFVSNITDIDDKIINLSLAEARPWQDITEQWERVWWDAMDAIDVARPDHVPHATDYVEQMVAFIGELIADGAAYVAADGVYFRPSVVDDYGLLARQSIESLQAGARIEVDAAKESPIDFALWKLAKPGEPSWPSPWGDGHPGWHTECVVMSHDLLGAEFDLHTGGQDLMFPHHENERAQASVVGYPFARHWMHHGFVEVAGEKMSKSLGNFTTLLDLLERHDGRAYRMLCLQSHYRSPIDVDSTTIGNAESALDRLDALARRVRGQLDSLPEPDPETIERFVDRMDDDLDTPGAVAVLFTTVTRANALLDAGDLAAAGSLVAALVSICDAVGLRLDAADAPVPPDVASLAAERDAARQSRDWARADAIRDELTDAGWVVEDTPEGTRVRVG